jgi:uncharacterized protein YgiB involved in biofilm formation
MKLMEKISTIEGMVWYCKRESDDSFFYRRLKNCTHFTVVENICTIAMEDGRFFIGKTWAEAYKNYKENKFETIEKK